MHQRFAIDLGVDKRHHGPKLDQTKPAEEKLRPVFHGNRAHITGAQTLVVKHVGHAVGLRVDLGIAIHISAVDQKRLIGETLCLGLKTIGQGVQVCRLDLRAGGRAQVQQLLGLFPRHGQLPGCPERTETRHIVHGATVSHCG